MFLSLELVTKKFGNHWKEFNPSAHSKDKMPPLSELKEEYNPVARDQFLNEDLASILKKYEHLDENEENAADVELEVVDMQEDIYSDFQKESLSSKGNTLTESEDELQKSR